MVNNPKRIECERCDERIAKKTGIFFLITKRVRGNKSALATLRLCETCYLGGKQI